MNRLVFFYTKVEFTQSHSSPLGDNEGFVQLIPNTYKSDKPKNITSVDKTHLKCNFFDGSVVNSVREPILYSFVLDELPGLKYFFKKI